MQFAIYTAAGAVPAQWLGPSSNDAWVWLLPGNHFILDASISPSDRLTTHAIDRFQCNFGSAGQINIMCSNTSHGSIECGWCSEPFNSTSEIDYCRVCGGDNSACTDCFGYINGAAQLDNCGECNGHDTTCCHDIYGIENEQWDYLLLPVSLDKIIGELEEAQAVLGWMFDNIPEEIPFIEEEHAGVMASINKLFLDNCLEEFCEYNGQILDIRLDPPTPAPEGLL